MHQDALVRRSPVFEQWAIPIAIGVVAIAIGVVVGKGGWYFLPALGLLPLLWYWPIEIAMGTAAVLLPFEYVSTLGEGSERSLMSVAIVLAFVVLCAVGVVARRLRVPSAVTLWWGLFVTWTVATTAWAVQPKMSLDYVPSVIALFLFYFAASSFRITEKEFDRIVLLSIMGGALAALMSIYGFYTGQHAARATLTVGGGRVNPNHFGSCLLLPLAFAVARFVSAKDWRGRVIALSFAGIIGLGLLLTLSRGSALAAVVTITIFLWRLKSSKLQSLKPNVRRFVILLVILVIVLGALAPTAFFERLQETGADRGSGRLDIWVAGLAILKDYFVLGVGLNNFPAVYHEYAGYASHVYSQHDADSHNTYLAISVEEGIIGLLLFLTIIRIQFKIVAKCRASIVGNPIVLICCEAALCGVLVASFFGNLLWDKAFWFAWVFLAFAVSIQTNKNSQEGALMRMSDRFNS